MTLRGDSSSLDFGDKALSAEEGGEPSEPSISPPQGKCYEVTSHQDVSCQEWCEEYAEGKGGMNCDPELDCFPGGESHPAVVDRWKDGGTDLFGVSCTKEPWADGLVRCGCK